MTVTEPHPEHPIVIPSLLAMHLHALSECVCEQLALNGAGPTCWCGLYPGNAVSWEYCSGGECTPDTCGMGYVRLMNGFPYEEFPVQAISDRCRRPLGWAVEVGALRCLPVGEEIPSPAEMTEVALRQYADALALHRAISCCDLPTFSLGGYQPLGPEGGCVGGAWLMYLSVD